MGSNRSLRAVNYTDKFANQLLLAPGTPLQNNVEELYPLFKFLRIRPLNDWTEFKTKISDPVKKNRTKGAMLRLHVGN